MNASLVCLVAALSAAPAADSSSSASSPFALVVRGQVPTYQDPLGPPTFQPAPGTGAPAFQPAPGTGAPFVQPADPWMSTPAVPNGGFLAPGQPGIGHDPCAPAFIPECPPHLTGAPAFCPPLGPPACGVFVGYESVFLKPFFSPAATIEFNGRVVDFDWGLEHTPRVWVGLIGPAGVGVQARYWQFDHSTEVLLAAPFLPAAALPNPIIARQDLEMHTLDLEAVLVNPISRGEIQFTGGVRYAKFDQTFGAVERLPAAVPPVAFSRHRFEGAGPTVSVLGRRFFAYGNLAAFASGRFAIVYGRTSEVGVAYDGDRALVNFQGKFDDLIPITELQIGAEWWCMATPAHRFFLRVALEGQVWYDAAFGVKAQGFPPPVFLERQSGTMGLFGFSIGTGFTF